MRFTLKMFNSPSSQVSENSTQSGSSNRPKASEDTRRSSYRPKASEDTRRSSYRPKASEDIQRSSNRPKASEDTQRSSYRPKASEDTLLSRQSSLPTSKRERNRINSNVSGNSAQPGSSYNPKASEDTLWLGRPKSQRNLRSRALRLRKAKKRGRKKLLAKNSVDSVVRPSTSESGKLRLSEVPPLYEEYESQRTESETEIRQITREYWDNQIEYCLVLVAQSVGLGNVWKFPFQAASNGGGIHIIPALTFLNPRIQPSANGAFFIPYMIVVGVVGIPMYFVEHTVSQFCSRGPLGVWDCVPIMRGIGWSMFLMSMMLSFFYVVILSWAALFFFFSFYTDLPWSNCTLTLYTSGGLYNVRTGAHDLKKPKCLNNTLVFDVFNSTANKWEQGSMAPEAAFFLFHILKTDPDIKKWGLGWPQFEVSAALAILWLIVFFITVSGSKISGKVAYFTALFPYVVLVILFVRAITLPGAKDGIIMLLTPHFENIAQVKVWFAAISQVFFSLGIGFGGCGASGSYILLHQKTYNYALIVGMADTFTSILAGFTVYSILGVLAKKLNIPVEQVVPSSGGGLSFVAYPMLMGSFGKYPVPNIFSVLFFAMLLTLGIGTAAGLLQIFEATVLDKMPVLASKPCYRIGVVGAFTVVAVMFGLIFCCPGSEHMLNMFDKYGCNYIVFFIVMVEIAAYAYIYGAKNLVVDFLFMFPDCKLDWRCVILRFWAYAMPIFFLVVFIYVAITEDLVEETKVNEFEPPWYLQVAGWTLFGVVAGTIPAYGIYVLFTRKTRSFYKKWMASITPNRHWGPKEPEEKAAWVDFKKSYDVFEVTEIRVEEEKLLGKELNPSDSVKSSIKKISDEPVMKLS